MPNHTYNKQSSERYSANLVRWLERGPEACEMKEHAHRQTLSASRMADSLVAMMLNEKAEELIVVLKVTAAVPGLQADIILALVSALSAAEEDHAKAEALRKLMQEENPAVLDDIVASAAKHVNGL